jgi:alpha-beta hydrolase superfamily lysophospholipase
MQSTKFTLTTPDDVSLHVYRWQSPGPVKAVVQIAHGWVEHAARYGRLAEALCAAGYAVFANDHRGHGRTARSSAELGFFAERDGWNHCVADLWQLHQRIAAELPGAPIIAMGHSLGSFMIQQFLSEHGNAVAGAVLSATNGKPPAIAPLALVLAHAERLRLGRHGTSKILQYLFIGALNKSFEPARTPFDWLSRDTAEVDKYLADPLCGFSPQVQAYLDVVHGLAEMSRSARQARIPRQLPIYIFYGSRDPVAVNMKQLRAAYRTAGLAQVTYKEYPDARHETLNEINRDEVTRDLIVWLDSVVERASQTAGGTSAPPGA